MSGSAETIYHQIKSNLDGRDDVEIVNETFTYPNSDRGPWMDEIINIIVCPSRHQRLDFDPDQLNQVVNSLKVVKQNSIVIGSLWQKLFLKEGGNIEALVFPSISYQEPLSSFKDVVNPVACLEYLSREGLTPYINKFHSRRQVSIKLYPDWSYAQQVYIYQRDASTEFIKHNPTLQSLTTKITREQIEALRGYGDYHLPLIELPDVPELFGAKTGK